MNTKFKTLDYIILVLILVISILVGLFYELKQKIINSKYFRKNFTTNNKVNDETFELEEIKNQSSDKTSEYLTGNASISSIPIAFSLLASFYSATALLGMPAEVYQYGIQYWMVVFGMMVTPVSRTHNIFCSKSNVNPYLLL